MALFTFLLEFDGGTYISQHRATSVRRALARYASHLLENKNLSTQVVRKRLTGTLLRDKPVTIEGVKNVWCCSASSGRGLALLNIVKTA